MMAYSKAKLKIIGEEVSPFPRPFSLGIASDMFTYADFTVGVILMRFISLTSFVGY
jgi:hypothetical protein